jgi:ketosteroid isomerase-like protein
MTKMDLTDFAKEWIAAWNAHDLERILNHYADDVELVSPFVAKLTGSEGSVRGKPALRDYFARGLKAFPTLRFELVRIYSGVRSCVLEYRSVNGLRTAEVMEFDEQGKVRRVLAHYSDEADCRSFLEAM